MTASRNLRTYICKNCDGRVPEGFTHQKYGGDQWSCKRMNWKRRATKAERALADIADGIGDAHELAAIVLGVPEDASAAIRRSIIARARR